MGEAYMSSQEIMHEIADLKIRLALQQEFEQEVAAIVEASNTEYAEQTQTMRALEEKVRHDMKRHMAFLSCQRKRRFPKSGRIIAAVLILLMVGMGSAFATVRMIQKGLLKLDVQYRQERTSYGLTLSEETFQVPDGWKGVFYPAYIPDGFVLVDDSFMEAEYQNDDQDSLSFSEYEYGTRVSLDTENASVLATKVNGADATLIEKDGWSAVVWSANNRLFVVEMDGSAEEVMKMAESVTLIP